jgi:hypothetical protein
MIMKECTWCDAELIELLSDIKFSAFGLTISGGKHGCIRPVGSDECPTCGTPKQDIKKKPS